MTTPSHTDSVQWVLEVNKKDIAYIVGIFEAYDHFAVVMDYDAVAGLSHEEVQKLEAIRPSTLGQASRISGVTPAAVTILMLLLERRRRAPVPAGLWGNAKL